MKAMILAILLASGSALAMPNVPDGSYSGKASWKDSTDNKGSYSVEMKVDNNKFSSAYNYGTKKNKYTFEVVEGSNNFFDVISGGKKVGEGYCMNVQCHYKATFGNTQMEETLTFWQDKLYRLGSKTTSGYKVSWEEAMNKLEQ